MTLERATEIVNGINAFAFYDMEVIGDAELRAKCMALVGVTLSEMCQAAAMVKAGSDDNVDGRRRVQMFPDDRLIAAVYAACNYKPSSNESIVCIPPSELYRKSALMLVEIPDADENEPD